MSSNNAPLSIDVVEANDDEVWALWEDSVTFQDSQFSLDAGLTSLFSPAQASEDVQAIDPFVSVTKNSN